MAANFEALLVLGRQRYPDLAAQEDAYADRLGAILASGDPQRVKEGSKALADWIDTRLVMVTLVEVDAMSDSFGRACVTGDS